MFSTRTALGSTLLTLGLAAFAVAQQPFRWEQDLETAQRIAAQTNRLVLVHFFAEWCEPCQTMEREVFSQPGFGADLVPYYVAVKLDVDQYPSTKEQLGVGPIPADIVMTPDGQVVQRMKGMMTAEQYSHAMRYIAANSPRGQTGGQLAQNQAGSPSQNPYSQPTAGYSPQQSATAPSQASGYPQGGTNVAASSSYANQVPSSNAAARSSDPTSTNDRYAEYYNRGTQPQPSQAAPPYGQQSAPRTTNPPTGGIAAGAPSAPMNYGTSNYTAPSQSTANESSGRYPSGQSYNNPGGQSYNGGITDGRYGAATPSDATAGRYEPSASSASAPAQSKASVANRGGFTPSPFAANSQTANQNRNSTTPARSAPGLGAAAGSPTSPTSNYTGYRTGGAANPSVPYGNSAGTTAGTNAGPGAGPAGQASQSAANPQAPQLPPGSPPLGLDGYCPVTLALKKVWTPGDVRYGVVHRGRTYLFTGAAEKEQFFANPDQYSPVMSGNDPVLALDHKQLVPGHREHGLFFDNRVFLFSSEASLNEFARNPSRYAAEVLQAMR